MNLFEFKALPNKAFSLFIIDFMFFITFFVIALLVYPLNQSLSYLLLIFITLAYALLNLTIGYLSLEHESTYMISMISVILGISHIISALSLLLSGSLQSAPSSFNTAITLLLFLRPNLTAIAILLTCALCSKKATLNKTLMIGSIVVLSFIFFISYNGFIVPLKPEIMHSLIYIKVSIMGMLYLVAIFYLWDNKIIKDQLVFISTAVLFISIIISEVAMGLSDYYTLGILRYLPIVIPLYILYNIQIQSLIFPKKDACSTRQHLYKLNSELMNKFFTFKNNEVENLRAEVDVKDGLYKQLFNFAPDAFLICNNGGIIYTNQAMISLLHASGESQILNASVWDFIHPDSTSLVKFIFSAISKPNPDTAVGEIKVVTLDGETKDVRLSSTMLGFHGKTYVICSLHDLSKEKAHQLIQSQLEENVAQEKFKVEFFANISHDLKTPVNVIYSAAQLQDICASDHEYDKVNIYNNVIKQNCLRLQKLLNDLLDMTKLDAHCLEPQLQTCNIIYVIESITQSVTTYMNEKNITVTFDTNVEEKFTLTDPDLIERILLNLISNAIKYGNKNGHIWVTLYDEGNHLIISVKDNGIGIPKSQAPFIFKRFHKVARKSEQTPNGNGIGLSLVKSIVDVLGGNISYISNEGQGSEFIVILPMASCNDECACSMAQNDFYSGNENTLNIELSDT